MIHATGITLAAALVTASCTGPSPMGIREQEPIPAGSTLVLERPLELAGGSARVFLQDGEVVPDAFFSGMDRFRPRCSFGLEKVDGEALVRTIEPDRFETGAAYNGAYVENGSDGGIQVASAIDGIQVAAPEHGGPNPGYLTYVLEIPLSSPRQPQVDDFTCRLDRPGEWRGQLGLQAIREAAGDIVRVELAE